MTDEFVLPDKAEDLCGPVSGQYVVSEISSARELTSEFFGIQQAFQDDGIKFILTHFDFFFGILRHFNDVSEKTKTDSYAVLLDAGEELVKELIDLFDNENENFEPGVHFKYRNIMKMSVYLLCKLAEAFETEAVKPSLVITDTKKGKKKTKPKAHSEESVWDVHRSGFVKCINHLYRLPISSLWDPPVVESEFVNMVTLSLFRLLENTDVTQNQSLCEEVLDLLGFSLKTYKNELAYSIKIIQLVQDFPHLPSVLSRGVCLFVKVHQAKGIISEIFRELSCVDSDVMLRETSRMHLLSQFIIDIAESCTDEVLASTNFLLPCLEEESHILRNCVLTVVGELLIKIAAAAQTNEMSCGEVRQRDELAQKLLDHMHDLNAFVRSKSLQVACRVLEARALPMLLQHKYLERACGRATRDKTSTVRKNGITFLKRFLVVNPFCIQLQIEELRTSYEKESAVLKEMVPQLLNSSQKQVVEFDSDDDLPMVKSCQHSSKNTDAGISATSKSCEHKENAVEIGSAEHGRSEATNERICFAQCDDEQDVEALKNNISKQQVLVDYLKHTLQQAELIIDAIPKLALLLKSNFSSDVIEAIEFFTVAFQLGLKDAVVGIKEMMYLVFSKDMNIRNAVICSYKSLYFSVEGGDGKKNASEIMAKNLIMFLHGASEAEVLAVEEFVKEFVRSGSIGKDTLDVLWDTFLKKSADFSDADSLSSLLILSMAASVDTDIVARKYCELVTAGLGRRGEDSFQLVRETCAALMKMCTTDDSSDQRVAHLRFLHNDGLFVKLETLLVSGVTNTKDQDWTSMAAKVTELIFKLADHPEAIVKSVIQKIIHQLLQIISCDDHDKKLSTAVFCRLIFLLGHVAYCTVIFCETDVYAELRRREMIKRKVHVTKEVPYQRHSASFGKKSDEIQIDDLQGLEVDDVISEFIANLCQREILSEYNLLGIGYSIVQNVCKWSLKNSHSDICSAASLSLAKFMSVKSDICGKNMKLLMTVLENSTESYVRSNIVIAMGDLITRFPNEVEPWASRLYNRLRDENAVVRMNTIIVLSHLILHDMIKVKGHMREIAACVVDVKREISNVAKHLFQELSKKKNALFNILPDVISGLSDSNFDLSEDDFQYIIRYIFKFIEKDRQIENLVEKLCQRFRETSNSKQVREIAFALSLLNFNEKCFQKLVESKSCFRDKLDDQMLVKCLLDIANSIKKHYPKLEYEVDEFLKEVNI